jgi:hypothetical protein
LVLRTVIFGAIVVLVDAAATWNSVGWWPPDWIRLRLESPTTGPDYVRQLLALLGLPAALLVALTSLAIPNLSPYTNPSVLLLHIRQPTGRVRRWMRLLFGRGNPFLDALQAALYVAGILAALFALNSIHWTESALPTVLIVTALALLEVVLLIHFLLWVIRLRQPSELLQYLRLLLDQDLAAIELPYGPLKPESRRALRRAAPASVRGPYTCRYEEQEAVKQLTMAITHATLRALTDQQPFSAREGLDVMQFVYGRSLRIYPSEWREMTEVFGQSITTNWLTLLAMDGFREVLLGSIGGATASVTKETEGRLMSVAKDLLLQDPTDDAAVTLEHILRQYISAHAKCLGLTSSTRHDLLDDLNELFAVLASPTSSDLSALVRVNVWRSRLQPVFRELARALGETCVMSDDVPAMRGVADFLHRASVGDTAMRMQVAEVVLNLGATAIAIRADRVAAMLAGWIVDILDRDALVLPLEAARSVADDQRPTLGAGGDEQLLRPDYVTVDYVQVFLILAAARGRQYGRARSNDSWQAPTTTQTVLSASESLVDKYRRPKWICERICGAVGYAPDETKTWIEEIMTMLPDPSDATATP